MGILSYEIEEIPDLSLNKYQSFSDNGIGGVLKRHTNFLRQWYGIGIESGISYHLLYVFLPNVERGCRLKLFFVLQGSEAALEDIKPLMKVTPLSDFYNFKENELPEVYFKAGATLTKKERVAELYNSISLGNKYVHYVPKWSVNKETRLYNLLKMMENIGSSYLPNMPCAYRIDLYPTSLVEETRAKVTPVIKAINGDNDIKLVKSEGSSNFDSYSKNVCREYEEWMSKVETTPHFRVNIYGFADSLFQAKILLNTVGAEAVLEGDFSIASIKEDSDGGFNLFSRMGCNPRTYCKYPQQAERAGIDSWSTTYCIEEVEAFFKLPALYDGEIIELPKETAPHIYSEGIYIGEDENGHSVYVPLEDITKHAFFTGTPGAGKTNSMLHFIKQLIKNRIPFLVLEPAKKEYRELLCNLDSDVHLFSPHMQSKFPLHVNPFQFPKGVRLSEHISALLNVFQGSFYLEGPTYKFLSSAIQKAYEKNGWDIENVYDGSEELEYPTLREVYYEIEKEILSSDYNKEIQGNVKSFLQVRLGGLLERDAGELFNWNRSTFSPEKWIEMSAIVELEVLDEQTKNFFILLICNYILETLRANPNGGYDRYSNKLMPVRHVLFIEEAHNIIAPTAQQSGGESVNPKISATAFIIKMLAEVRALREGIVIADQLPTALASEVNKNTGLKLVHRLTSQDDRTKICSTISASPRQVEQVATFSKGKALVFYEKLKKPFSIQVAKWSEAKINYDFANDELLFRNICAKTCIKDTIKFAMKNYISKMISDCDKANRNVKKRKEILDNKNKLERLKKLWLLDEVLEFKEMKEEVERLFSYFDECINNINETIDKKY